jgi:hypothetical protein
MKNMINATHVEGLVYESTLELRVSGENSKNPGTEFIMGNLNIATDNDCTNIVPVHFTYVTATTSKGNANATFGVLKDIVDGKIGTVMANGKENAGKVRIDSAIGLNEFYSDRNGKEELVSAKRNEGGFVHTVATLNADEKARNTFTADMLITSVTHVIGDEEKGTKEKALVRGCVFDFRKAILPVEFSVTNARGMDYFEGLDASPKSPVFTKVWGRQISTTVKNTRVEESGWGEANVQESTSTRRDWVITGSNTDPYEWDSEDTITAKELTEAMANREVYLAGIKQRQDEYKASKAAPAAAVPANTGFNF